MAEASSGDGEQRKRQSAADAERNVVTIRKGRRGAAPSVMNGLATCAGSCPGIPCLPSPCPMPSGCRSRPTSSSRTGASRRPRRPTSGLARVVQVGEVVTELVVAVIVRHAGRAAVDGRLLRRLDPLGPGEETAGGDAAVNERAVVGTAVERRRRGGQALRGEVVVEHLLDVSRPVWPLGPRARAVAV